MKTKKAYDWTPALNGAAIGVTGGATIGWLLGYLMKSDKDIKRRRASAALAGGLIGGSVGAGAGYVHGAVGGIMDNANRTMRNIGDVSKVVSDRVTSTTGKVDSLADKVN
jgi:hypothetical protein